MNAVIDEDLPRSFAKVLSDLGFRSLDIRNHNLRGEDDKKIFEFAQKNKAVIFFSGFRFFQYLGFSIG